MKFKAFSTKLFIFGIPELYQTIHAVKGVNTRKFTTAFVQQAVAENA
jgi:hypothetical protein